MNLIADALTRRFDGDATLKRKCRKLYFGFEGEREKTVMPYVEVSCEDESHSASFGHDFEDYTIRFSVFSKDARPSVAGDLMDELMRVFDYAQLTDARFTTVKFMRTSGGGPRLVDGVYQGFVEYEVTVQRAVASPILRYA